MKYYESYIRASYANFPLFPHYIIWKIVLEPPTPGPYYFLTSFLLNHQQYFIGASYPNSLQILMSWCSGKGAHLVSDYYIMILSYYILILYYQIMLHHIVMILVRIGLASLRRLDKPA